MRNYTFVMSCAHMLRQHRAHKQTCRAKSPRVCTWDRRGVFRQPDSPSRVRVACDFGFIPGQPHSLGHSTAAEDSRREATDRLARVWKTGVEMTTRIRAAGKLGSDGRRQVFSRCKRHDEEPSMLAPLAQQNCSGRACALFPFSFFCFRAPSPWRPPEDTKSYVNKPAKPSEERFAAEDEDKSCRPATWCCGTLPCFPEGCSHCTVDFT